MKLKLTEEVVRACRALSQAVFALGLIVSLAGCSTVSIKNPGVVVGPFHKPANYHLANRVMPDDMRRVA